MKVPIVHVSVWECLWRQLGCVCLTVSVTLPTSCGSLRKWKLYACQCDIDYCVRVTERVSHCLRVSESDYCVRVRMWVPTLCVSVRVPTVCVSVWVPHCLRVSVWVPTVCVVSLWECLLCAWCQYGSVYWLHDVNARVPIVCDIINYFNPVCRENCKLKLNNNYCGYCRRLCGHRTLISLNL